MREEQYEYPTSEHMLFPEITLHCDQDSCNGNRLFKNTKIVILSENKDTHAYVYYKCKNCGITVLISELEAAKNKNQFSKAVESIKHTIPQVLLIDGHNPLTLLHSALSEGLHAKTDEECLELATSIRVVLTELVERMSTALKDTAELKTAVSRIINK